MPVSWMCKKQGGVSLSTMEAEFTAASIMARKLLGVRKLLQELNLEFKEPMPLRVDNQEALKHSTVKGPRSRPNILMCASSLSVISPNVELLNRNIERPEVCQRTY